MGLFASMFGRKQGAGSSDPDGRSTEKADTAIRDARAGRITVPQMLHSVLAAQVIVPLAEPPVMDGASVTRWKPATVSKQANGAQFLVAFTDRKLATAFSENNREHSFALLVDAAWVLSVLPEGHGIAFNVGGDNGFEWTAEGISAYKTA